MNNLTGGGLLAKTLQAAGVTEVFSLHGGHLDAFLVACKEHGIRLTDTRHEASAGHAAEAYARATGKIGVAVLTAGPGFANALTAMANAFVDRMPVLFIVGAPSSREADLNTLQGGIDQIAAASHMTKWAYRIANGARVPEIVEQAIRRAMSGAPGPVLLEIPIEVMFTKVVIPERAEKLDNFGGNAGAAPSSAQIAALLDLLQRAERPVIIAGGGATLSRSAEALSAFAELAQVPVVTGAKAEGLMPQQSEFYGGGSMSVPVAAAMGAAADVVLLLGVRIGLFTGGRYGLMSPAAKVAQIDIDGAEPGRGGQIDLAMTRGLPYGARGNDSRGPAAPLARPAQLGSAVEDGAGDPEPANEFDTDLQRRRTAAPFSRSQGPGGRDSGEFGDRLRRRRILHLDARPPSAPRHRIVPHYRLFGGTRSGAGFRHRSCARLSRTAGDFIRG